MRSLHENIADICVLDLGFCYLDLGSTLVLEASDCLAGFTND